MIVGTAATGEDNEIVVPATPTLPPVGSISSAREAASMMAPHNTSGRTRIDIVLKGNGSSGSGFCDLILVAIIDEFGCCCVRVSGSGDLNADGGGAGGVPSRAAVAGGAGVCVFAVPAGGEKKDRPGVAGIFDDVLFGVGV
mmetsp:Transcript_14739/g.36054  ORF Transcript_14739/g.36054 Transcript_14739/m.36054 type:complete len:141 (+) Transcript_14739:4579-5001(+)